MNHVLLIIRISGWVLALLLLASVYLAISGVISSDEVPPLADRMLSALPAASIGILLFLPHDLFLRGWRHWLLLSGYLFAAAFVGYLAVDSVLRYAAGSMHVSGVILSGIFLGVVVANGLVLLVRRRKRPNDSFKPTPLRGAA